MEYPDRVIGFEIRECYGPEVYKHLDDHGQPIPLTNEQDLRDGDVANVLGLAFVVRRKGAKSRKGTKVWGDGKHGIILKVLRGRSQVLGSYLRY
jgi:hypothetical protein